MGCGSCHTLAAAGSSGTVGPDLDQRLPTHDRESLIAKITMRPGSRGADFSAMPQNFGSRMDAAELNELVEFLLAAKRG
jgi:cytochrome c oxidase subunit 2